MTIRTFWRKQVSRILAIPLSEQQQHTCHETGWLARPLSAATPLCHCCVRSAVCVCVCFLFLPICFLFSWACFLFVSFYFCRQQSYRGQIPARRKNKNTGDYYVPWKVSERNAAEYITFSTYISLLYASCWTSLNSHIEPGLHIQCHRRNCNFFFSRLLSPFFPPIVILSPMVFWMFFFLET